jgi:hypothetical protein
MAARQAGQGLRRPRRLEPEHRADPRERRTRIIPPVALSPEVTSGLVETSARRGTSVHAAVCAATLHAAALDLGRPGCVRLACHSSINIRRMLRPRVGRNELGMYASSITTYHDVCPDSDLWTHADRAAAGLLEGIARGDQFAGAPFARWIRRLYGLKDRNSMKYGLVMERGNPTSLVVSTTTPVSPDQSVGPFTVDGLGAGLAMSWYGLVGVNAGLKGDSLSVGFVHVEPAISSARAARFADAVIQGLDEMA